MEIIIVDDEPVSRTALKQLVEKQPECSVRSFTQAGAALAWCNQNDPDVVIVGYVMPELNGIDFIERFRAIPGKRETPVLMVTANSDLELRSRALRAGINDFLNKPYDFSDLQVRVSNMLLLRSKQKNLPDRGSFLPPEVPRPAASDKLLRKNADTLLDLAMTLTRLGDDETLLGHVARVFTRTAPALLESIGAALAGNDIERAYGEAHSLKGAVAVFEAPDVFNSIVAVETHATNYDSAAAMAAFHSARGLVQRLLDELAPLVAPGVGGVAQA
ncbi:MAG: response regulator [Burkholderiales bacterium]